MPSGNPKIGKSDAVDPKSRHKGKYESEAYLEKIGMPYTSIRPTYIYGPLNYNPLEQYFFERLDQDRPVIVPGEMRTNARARARARDSRAIVVIALPWVRVLSRKYRSPERVCGFDAVPDVLFLAFFWRGRGGSVFPANSSTSS